MAKSGECYVMHLWFLQVRFEMFFCGQKMEPFFLRGGILAMLNG